MPRTTNRPLTVAALLLSSFMAAMEMTVVSPAMPTVVGDLKGLPLYSWVFTAYLLASTITIPLYGKLADLYGRKPVILFGLGLFVLASAASGQARSMAQLILFRGIQGLGAGAMQPIALTIIGDIFSLDERARMQGVFGAVWGFAGIVGPLLGGHIVELLSWRWIFYINVPFGLAAAATLILALHEKVERRSHRLDVEGAAFLASFTLGILFAFHNRHWTAAALGLAAAFGVAFVLVERRASEPLLPLGLLRHRTFTLSSAGGMLVGGAMLSTLTYLPLFVALHGGNSRDVGLTLMPMVLAWPVSSVLGGRLILRWGFRPVVRMGLTMLSTAGVLLAVAIQSGASPILLRVAMGLLGLGLGFTNTSLLIAIQTSVAWQQRGIATASTMFFRIIGGTLSVGLLGALLATFLARARVPEDIIEQFRQLAARGADASRNLGAASVAMEGGLRTIFWIIAGLCCTAFVVCLPFPKQPAESAREAAAVPET